jgi:PAS domain S-box-containing protein
MRLTGREMDAPMQQQRSNGEVVANEGCFSRVAGCAHLMIWISGPNHFCTFPNRKWLRFTGKVLETEVAGGPGEVHPNDVARCSRDHQRAYAARREFLLEYRVSCPDGTCRWILDKGMPFSGVDGQFAGYMGSCIEITNRKEVEEELRRSEERYRAVVEDQTELICRFLPDGTITFVNDAYCRYFNRSRRELTGKSFWPFIPVKERKKAREHLASISFQRPVATIEHQIVVRKKRRWQQWTDRGIFDSAGNLVEFQSVGRDITVQKEGEGALVESEAKFRAIFDLNLVALAYWRADGLITDANEAYLRLVGYSREELKKGTVRWDLLTLPEDRHLDEHAIKELESGRRFTTPFQKRYRRRDGTIVPVLIGGALLPGFKDRGVAFAIDLSDQKRLESELMREKALNSAIISSLSGHVAVIDRGGRIIAVNESWVQFAAEAAGATHKVDIGANYLEVCGKALRCSEATAKAALEGIHAVLAGAKPVFVMQCQCDSMPAQWFEMRVEPLRRPEGGAVISHIDVTDRVRAEIEAEHHRRELAHVVRITLLGEITASMAHELNQPLTAIVSNAQAGQRLIGKEKRSFAEVQDILTDIVADGRRAGEVIHRLRALLKKDEPQRQPLDVNALIEQTLHLVHSEMIIRHVAVEKQFETGLPAVLGDRIQLQQVILNLILNAAQAMGQCPPPDRKLVLSTFANRGRIAIKVRDFGVGLDPKYREQIFQPFFTTKDDGMGVGLWINRAIIEAHAGELLAANNEDKGATFHVMLPAYKGERI